MKALAVFFAAFSLAGSAAADCLTPDLNPPGGPEIRLDVLRHTGLTYYVHGQLPDSAVCYLEAFDLAGRTEKFRNSSVTDLGNLALIAQKTGNYTEAANYLTRQLSLIEKLGFAKAAVTASVYMKRGELDALRGRFSEAEESYTKSIDLFTQYAGGENLQAAGALSGLGRLYMDWGKNSQAAYMLRKARSIAEKSLPQDDPQLIPFLDAEGSFLAATGRFTDGEKELKKALSIAQRVYGEKLIEYAGVMLHLGEMYLLSGEFPQAVEVLSRCLEAELTTPGSDPLDEARIVSGLADAYAKQGKLAEAEPLARKAVASAGDCTRVPSACSWLHSKLGDFYMQESDWQSAVLQFEQALKLRQDSLGESHDVACSMTSLAQALRRLNRKKEAKAYEARAAQILASHRTPGYDGVGIVDVRSLRSTQ
jgi:tetratricopeptide (TPR) repeat protein